jgi:hypothetical protein
MPIVGKSFPAAATVTPSDGRPQPGAGWLAPGEWLKHSVNDAAAGTYQPRPGVHGVREWRDASILSFRPRIAMRRLAASASACAQALKTAAGRL